MFYTIDLDRLCAPLCVRVCVRARAHAFKLTHSLFGCPALDIKSILLDYFFRSWVELFPDTTGVMVLATAKKSWASWGKSGIIHIMGKKAVDLGQLPYFQTGGRSLTQTASIYLKSMVVNIVLDRMVNAFGALRLNLSITLYHTACSHRKSSLWQCFLHIANKPSNFPSIMGLNSQFNIGLGVALSGIIIILSAYSVPVQNMRNKLTRRFWANWDSMTPELADLLELLTDAQIIDRSMWMEAKSYAWRKEMIRLLVLQGVAYVIMVCSQSYPSLKQILTALKIGVTLVICTEVADITNMADSNIGPMSIDAANIHDLFREPFGYQTTQPAYFMETANNYEATMYKLIRKEALCADTDMPLCLCVFEGVPLTPLSITPYWVHSIADMLAAGLNSIEVGEADGMLVLSNVKNTIFDWCAVLQEMGWNVCSSVYPVDDIVAGMNNVMVITSETVNDLKMKFDEVLHNHCFNGIVKIVIISAEVQGIDLLQIGKHLVYGITALHPGDTAEHVSQMIARFRNSLHVNGELPHCFPLSIPLGVVLVAFAGMFVDASLTLINLLTATLIACDKDGNT